MERENQQKRKRDEREKRDDLEIRRIIFKERKNWSKE